MGAKSKQIGYRAEVGIVKRWIAAGLKCQRVILSGAMGHILGEEYQGDVKATIGNENITIQSKYLANGWPGIYTALQNHDVLIIKAKRKEALVVIPESLFLSLVCGDMNGPEGEQLCDGTAGELRDPEVGC